MNILRDFSQWGSALVMDVKGELYAHTARYFDHVYRVDLENPNRSDLWNPLPRFWKWGTAHSTPPSWLVTSRKHEVNDSTHYGFPADRLLKHLLHPPHGALIRAADDSKNLSLMI